MNNNIFSIPHFDWPQIAAFSAVVSLIMGLVWRRVGAMLARSFVSHTEHAALKKQLEGVRMQLDNVATKDEVRELVNNVATKMEVQALSQRITPMEIAFATLNERVASLQLTGSRTEHMVSLLLEHNLDRERVT